MRLRTSLLFAAAAVMSTAAMIVPVEAAPGPVPGPLACPAASQGTQAPVLLVRATAETGERNFSANYGRVLPAMGYDVCTVELVDLARGDIQASAERVVYAIRTISGRSQRKVQVIGHSEGPLPVRWAIKWWPDVGPLVDDLISIAGPYHGWLLTDVFCSGGRVPALWQMRRKSEVMAAFNTREGAPRDLSHTAVYSITGQPGHPAP